MNFKKYAGFALAVMVGAALLVGWTHAGQAGGKYGARGYSYITVQSKYGNGTISAPVRSAQYGWQVRLPGGVWIYCELNCFQTLRDETVDFYETIDEYSGN